MRRRRLLILGILSAALIAVALAWPKQTEAERVETETLWAIKKMDLLQKKTVTSSPRMMVELTLRSLRKPNDPEGDYQKAFFKGMERMVELRVLEKQSFSLSNTNARKQLNSIATTGFSKDLLWILSWESNGTVTVTARPTEMPKWKKLIEDCARSNTVSAPATAR